MIITRIYGGLGNQLFQYAAGLSLAHARNTVLKLDVSWFSDPTPRKSHERYALSSFNLPAQFATAEEIDRLDGVTFTRTERWSAKVARALRFLQYARKFETRGHFYHDTGHRFDPAFFAQPDHTYLHGNWQSEQFFAPIQTHVRAHLGFRFPLTPELAAIAKTIRQSESAFVHVRRGDYVKDPTYAAEIGALDPSYYQRAMERLCQARPGIKFYVFSDDIEAVARELRIPGAHEFVREPADAEPAQIMHLMSICDHAIISNSTFSWWAAWLNPSSEKIVIAPEPWFAGQQRHGGDIVPARWERLPRHAAS